MSLDISLIDSKGQELYSANITHNLGKMANKAGLYEALWRPYMLKPNYNPKQFEDNYESELEFEENNPTFARELIKAVKKGLMNLLTNPDYYEQFNSPNGWGMYEHFVPFVVNYLIALSRYPNAIVRISR